MSSLEQFLTTGDLGPLRIGASIDEVRKLLGEPESSSVRGSPVLWKYGSLELAFPRISREEAPYLGSIGLYFRFPEDTLPKGLTLSGWYPPIGCSFQDFLDHLGKMGIRVQGGVTVGPDKHIIVGPGVQITFDQDVIDSIYYFTRKESDRKQLSISIPPKVLDRVRIKARAQGISMSALCSKWVEERAIEEGDVPSDREVFARQTV